MLNANAAAFNFNRLSYDNYAWPGTPDPRRINHLGRSRNDSQVFIYFVLINARNWLRLVALASNEGSGAEERLREMAAATEKGIDRPRRGGFAQQPERSSRSPLTHSLGQPCNFRPLPVSLTNILWDHQIFIELLFFVSVRISSIFACNLCLHLYIYICLFDICSTLVQIFNFRFLTSIFISSSHFYL